MRLPSGEIIKSTPFALAKGALDGGVMTNWFRCCCSGAEGCIKDQTTRPARIAPKTNKPTAVVHRCPTG